MAEDFATRVKRLKFRSRHRGTKELDLVLGAFAERHLDAMSADEVALYEAILEANETELWRWLSGRVPVPREHDNPVMARLLAFDYAPDPCR